MKKNLLLSILFIYSGVNFSQTFIESNQMKDEKNYLLFNHNPLSSESINQIIPFSTLTYETIEI